MALFRRRSADNADPGMSTGDPDDDKILRILAQNSQLDEPRHWVHNLSFPGRGSSAYGRQADCEHGHPARQHAHPRCD